MLFHAFAIHVQSRALTNRLCIPGSVADYGPEQLAFVRLGMILDAVHVAGGDAEHIAGRQDEALSRLEQLNCVRLRLPSYM